jgi:transcriptional regulator with XRE-family HTH domain
MVAASCEISVQQLTLYENGNGNPPAATLHRIAFALGTTSSSLMGETMSDPIRDQFDEFAALYSDPYIGDVTRIMQEMPADTRKQVRFLVGTIARMPKPPQTAEVMK